MLSLLLWYVVVILSISSKLHKHHSSSYHVANHQPNEKLQTVCEKYDRLAGIQSIGNSRPSDNLSLTSQPGVKLLKYKVIILTCRCLIGTAPRYLAADCVPVSEMAQRRHLHGLRAFSVLGPRLWNSLSCGCRVSHHLYPYNRDGTGSPCQLDCCVTLATTLMALDIL